MNSAGRDLAGLVAAVFDDDGPLAGALDSYEAREGQQRMAAAVADAFAQGGTLLVEAGTGTGKTLAYLVPAILGGQRVLVSTGTKNLQDQIVHKDLPLLRHALDRPFTATVMKGRGNYLCLHRFESFRQLPARRAASDRVHLTLIEEWLPRTTTGDRAEIAELPEEVSFWSDIAATTENCLGSQCPRYAECFVTRMRQRAVESDLVVVNHHLLCADAAVRQHTFGEVIPECACLVLDEAHQLEDVATQYFGVAVSTHRFEELVRDGERVLGLRQVSDRLKAAAIREALTRVDRQAAAMFSALVRTPSGGEGRPAKASGLFDERVRISEEGREGLAEIGQPVLDALDAAERAVGAVKDPPDDVAALGRRAAELREHLGFLLRGDEDGYVYFIETRGRGVFLRAMPVDVSRIVRDDLLGRASSVVLTSATLAVNGSFDYLTSRLGLREARTLQLPSEFDYRRQAILYLPRSMPDPRTREFAAEAAAQVTAILERTEGRAFVLFTSYATLNEVRARIESAVPYPLLVQGSAPRGVLLERFRSTPNAVLLATASFWQGVDVVGEALSCVVIDKLPFASPGDPVTQARLEAIARDGGNPFDEYQVPLAVLTLLQGIGRLLRHRSDRGVLAILDPRLRTKGYGRRFLDSLPPARVTHDLDDIARFLNTPP